ncbi:hypothetical protein EXE46_11575 [Halorubrum sp. GN11_10-6_MGM]|uniref:hypothetical protein n=1 Tax=Halorubrum sp. GN11_10-6_MGM TaxID=2518112 RepID=UPI0010F70F42|nr:hypothetical protein [Halorubrum sp. GN11_10-6_MGM]TKX73965.1 hypothetical protein EXE46_11575 [Halorubrum sp. GN11_10-6_MGM]
MTHPDDRADGRDAGEPDPSVRRPTRRGVVALGTAGLLAGCLVTSEEEAPGTRQTDDGPSGDDSDNDGGDGGGSDGDGGGSDGEAEPTPDQVGPDGSGLVVTDATVLEVREGGGRTTVEVRLLVENAGRFEYGTVEFRVDAYATPAGSDEREAVGYGDATGRFGVENRFRNGDTESFAAEITFPSSRSRVRPDPDRYAVDAAVRRAEPI